MIKKGSKVIIRGSAEEKRYKDCVFEVLSEPYLICDSEVVKMKCHETGKYFGGGYATEFLVEVGLMAEYDIQKATQAQAEYLKRSGAPDFAPHSGICWKCHKNIYEQLGWKIENGRQVSVPLDSPELKHTTGITVEEAGTSLVTGCPHCNRSYCD